MAGREGLGGVLGPGVLGVAAAEVFADDGVAVGPEGGEVGGDLDGTLGGGEEGEEEGRRTGQRKKLSCNEGST